jgi:sialate O-acetylesterase
MKIRKPILDRGLASRAPRLVLLAAILSLTGCPSGSKPPAAPSGTLRVATVFGDNMVLQCDRPLPVWGRAGPGERVTVTLGTAREAATADAEGRWRVQLPPQAATSQPLELIVAGQAAIRFANVLIGEVWLCSGQSNMEWDVAHSTGAAAEIAAGDQPLIRHLKIHHGEAPAPQDDLDCKAWEIATPKTVGEFTAVGYAFARELQARLGKKIPIGLVNASRGGTRIEPWIAPEGYRRVAALADIAGKLDRYPEKNETGGIDHQSPLALYNRMIHPLVPFAIRGVLWYQGEQNRTEGMLYRDKMQALIEGWRAIWNQGDFPVYFAQIAPYRHQGNDVLLAELWEAQTAVLAIPNTGMAGTSDIAALDEIHPPNKADVGKRLALWALAKTYGSNEVVCSGPLYDWMSIEGSAIRLRFEHTAGGLVARNGKPLDWFSIAGADRRFHPAQAQIDGESLVVSSPEVPEPVAVRFGWNQIAQPNLANRAGLPAIPFRTDRWKE